MLTAGDEFGRTQHGNNNAYAQDNDITWLDWPGATASWRPMSSRAARHSAAMPRRLPRHALS